MSDSSPARVPVYIDRILSFPGRETVLLDFLPSFASPEVAAAWKSILDTGDSVTAAAFATLAEKIPVPFSVTGTLTKGTYTAGTGATVDINWERLASEGDQFTVTTEAATHLFEFDSNFSVNPGTIAVETPPGGFSSTNDCMNAIVSAVVGAGLSDLTAALVGGHLVFTNLNATASSTLSVSNGWSGPETGSDTGSDPVSADGTDFLVIKNAESGKRHFITHITATLAGGEAWDQDAQVCYGATEGSATAAATLLTPGSASPANLQLGGRIVPADNGSLLGTPPLAAALSLRRPTFSSQGDHLTVRVSGYTLKD